MSGSFITRGERFRFGEYSDDQSTETDSTGEVTKCQILLLMPALLQEIYGVAAAHDVQRGLTPSEKACTPFIRNSKSAEVHGTFHINCRVPDNISGELAAFWTSSNKTITAQNVINIFDSLPGRQKISITKLKGKYQLNFNTGNTPFNHHPIREQATDPVPEPPGWICIFVKAPFVAGLSTTDAGRAYGRQICQIWFSHSSNFFGYELAPTFLDEDVNDADGDILSANNTATIPQPMVNIAAPGGSPFSSSENYSCFLPGLADDDMIREAADETAIVSSQEGAVAGTTGQVKTGVFRRQTLHRVYPAIPWSIKDGPLSDTQLWSFTGIAESLITSAIGGIMPAAKKVAKTGLQALFGPFVGDVAYNVLEGVCNLVPDTYEAVETLVGTVFGGPGPNNPSGAGWPTLVDVNHNANRAAGFITAGAAFTAAVQAFQTTYPDVYKQLSALYQHQTVQNIYAVPTRYLFAPNDAAGQPAYFPATSFDTGLSRTLNWITQSNQGFEVKQGYGQPHNPVAIISQVRQASLPTSSTALSDGNMSRPRRGFVHLFISNAGILTKPPVYSSGTAHTVGAAFSSWADFLTKYRFAQVSNFDTGSGGQIQAGIKKGHLSLFDLATSTIDSGYPLHVSDVDDFYPGWIANSGQPDCYFTLTKGVSTGTSRVRLPSAGSGKIWILSGFADLMDAIPDSDGTIVPVASSSMTPEEMARELRLMRAMLNERQRVSPETRVVKSALTIPTREHSRGVKQRLLETRLNDERALPDDAPVEIVGYTDSDDDPYIGDLQDDPESDFLSLYGARATSHRSPLWDEDDCLCRKAFRCEQHPSRNEFTALMGMGPQVHREFRRFLKEWGRAHGKACLHTYALNCPYLHDHAPRPKPEVILNDHVAIQSRAAIVAELNRLTGHFHPV